MNFVVKPNYKNSGKIFGSKLKLTVAESTDTINEYLTSMGEPTITNGDEHYYILTLNDPNSSNDGEEYFFIAKKDSSKVNNKVSFKSSDSLQF